MIKKALKWLNEVDLRKKQIKAKSYTVVVRSGDEEW
ncbi:MAG: hypothetical protein ACI9FJ_000955 [Alteromonadaceae bacterium]|jgi:hypothetical protein